MTNLTPDKWWQKIDFTSKSFLWCHVMVLQWVISPIHRTWGPGVSSSLFRPTLEALASCPSPGAFLLSSWLVDHQTPPTQLSQLTNPPNDQGQHDILFATSPKKPIPHPCGGKETDQLPCPNLKSHGSGRPQKPLFRKVWAWLGDECFSVDKLKKLMKTTWNLMIHDYSRIWFGTSCCYCWWLRSG